MPTSTSVTVKSVKSVKSAKSDRMSAADFDVLMSTIRKDGVKAESSVQRGFMAAWRDIAASHSTDRLERLWQVLSETKSPYRTQVSTAIRALAGMAKPVKNSQKWERTGREPLRFQSGAGWTLTLDDDDKRELSARLAWGEVHFRAITVKTAKAVFTWAEASAFAERIRKNAKLGNIPEGDAAKLAELLGEIERIAAR